MPKRKKKGPSLKQQRRANISKYKMAWQIARQMTRSPNPYPMGKLYCPICGLHYENTCSGIQFCRECPYPNCTRETRQVVVCRYCEEAQ